MEFIHRVCSRHVQSACSFPSHIFFMVIVRYHRNMFLSRNFVWTLSKTLLKLFVNEPYYHNVYSLLIYITHTSLLHVPFIVIKKYIYKVICYRISHNFIILPNSYNFIYSPYNSEGNNDRTKLRSNRLPTIRDKSIHLIRHGKRRWNGWKLPWRGFTRPMSCYLIIA